MRRQRLVGIALPLLITAVAAVVLAIWLPRLPDPVATHWSGAPDGFTSRSWFVPVAALLIAGTSLPSALMALFLGRGSWGRAHRVLVSLAPALAALLGTLVISLARVQIDLVDAAGAQTPGIGPPLLVGAAAWLLAWAMSPPARRASEPRPAPIPAPSTADRDTPTSWSTTLRPGAPLLGLLAVAMVPLLVLSIWSLATRGSGWWIFPLALLGTGLLLGSFLAFRVTIDPEGLHAQSLLGWPRFHVPVSQIDSIEVRTIDPLGDFGGWGLRWGRRRVGIVLRTGEGLLLTRTDGRVFGITCDDAATAAAILGREHTSER